MTAKTLLPTQIRFEVREINKAWRVYDVADACFPYRTPELGVVLQDVSKEEAELEAQRLNDMVSIDFAKKTATKTTKPAGRRKTVQAADVPAAEDPIPEVEAYDMSDEDKAKYEEGLFEDVKY